MSLEKIIVVLLFVSLMLSAGLQADREHLKAALTNFSLIGRALLANFIVVPLFAYLLVRALHLNEFVGIGILLMAIAPGVPFLPRAAGRKSGGSLGFAIALAFTMPALSIITVPLTARLVFPPDAAAQVPVGNLMVTLIVFQLLPLLIGMVIAARSPSLAARLNTPMTIIFAVCLVALLVMLAPALIKDIGSVYGSLGIITAFLVVIFGLCAGWVLGGPESKYRHTLSIGTALRNIGLALLVATASFPGTLVAATVMSYFIIQVLASLVAGKLFARGMDARPAPAT